MNFLRKNYNTMFLLKGDKFAKKFSYLFRYEEKILVYILFSWFYDYTSYIWLNLGLHPKINIQIFTENYIFSKMNYVPTDLIKIIVQYIPSENYRPLTIYEKLLQTILDHPDKPWSLNKELRLNSFFKSYY